MKKLDELTACVAAAAAKKYDEIAALPTEGPRGGRNVKYIPGWTAPGIAILTRAINKAGIPTMPYWSGPATTPTTAFPACIRKEALEAVALVYQGTASGKAARRALR